MQLNAKDFALPIEKIKGSCSEITQWIGKNNKIDLGNPQALYQYNKCLFKVLDNIIIDLDVTDNNIANLIPTAGLRRSIVHIVLETLNPKKLIEIGTGATAIMALLFAKRNVQVIATEISPFSYESAQKHLKINNLNNLVSIIKSEGGILSYLDEFFPVDCVISLPPYYANETKNAAKSKRGFKGTESELYSFGESSDFSLHLLKEWLNLSSIPAICILWKNKTEMEKTILTIKNFRVITQIVEILAGTRLRYLTISIRSPNHMI